VRHRNRGDDRHDALAVARDLRQQRRDLRPLAASKAAGSSASTIVGDVRSPNGEALFSPCDIWSGRARLAAGPTVSSACALLSQLPTAVFERRHRLYLGIDAHEPKRLEDVADFSRRNDGVRASQMSLSSGSTAPPARSAPRMNQAGLAASG
jgi:hypothetical protein